MAVGAVQRRGEALLVTKRHSHRLKLHRAGVVPFVKARGTGLDVKVLDRRPAVSFAPNGRTRPSPPAFPTAR